MTALRAEATLEAEAETRGKVGLYVISLKLLARIKSMVQGSVERRQTIRRELQRYSADLLSRVNQLLDGAARVLERNGKSPDLLIVLDNLDRLDAEPAERLFIEKGDLLGQAQRPRDLHGAGRDGALGGGQHRAGVRAASTPCRWSRCSRRAAGPYTKGIDALVALIARARRPRQDLRRCQGAAIPRANVRAAACAT